MEEKSLTPHQSTVYKQIKHFIDSPNPGVFILKGYAGTGKTFLMQYLAQELAKEKINFSLHASTGRAAAILKAKTNFEASTIHSALYIFHEVEGDDEHMTKDAEIEEYGQMRLIFDLRAADESGKRVYIIDESSMISDIVDKATSFATFGSGRLLTDLMTVAGKNKIIFTGDPCQLPPVLGIESPSMSEKWFIERGYKVTTGELKEIIRQKGGNKILQLATRVRGMVNHTPIDKFPKILASDLKGKEVKLLPDYNMLDAYLDFTDEHGYYQSIAISNSNKSCFWINKKVRERRYGEVIKILMPGDLLMVTQNNYLVPLTNGDLVELVSIGEKRRHCQLTFINVRVKSVMKGEEYEILLCLDPLDSGLPNITEDQHKLLMIDFSKRMKEKGVKPKTEAYNSHLSSDPYLNSLKVSYGYAVTCHKSQGGEWDHVFLFLNRYMFTMGKEKLLRWWYTGITRAKKELYLADDGSSIV